MFYKNKGDIDEEKIFIIPCACVVAVSCAGACGDENGGINKLTAESGITADGAFEKGSALEAEHHAADSEQGKAAISEINKPYDSAKIAVFDITLTKGGKIRV